MRPERPEGAQVDVFRCEGCVSDVASFLERHLDCLSHEERAWLNLQQSHWPKHSLPSEVASGCLTINPEWADEREPAFEALRSGDRSAYWWEKCLKIKGCNPALDERSTFPFQVLPYAETSLQRKEIAYGVLSAEAAVREVFASVFCQHHGIPVSTEPVLVYEYAKCGKRRGCAIVLLTAAETRLESFLEDLPFSVHDVQRARELHLPTIGDVPLGSEQPLRGLNVWWWAEEKARALVQMHWAGGFRGVLNSNLGNDVVAEGPTGRSLLLCDFDSFEYHAPPRTSSVTDLVPFLRKSVVEVLLGSLPIIDFIEAADAKEATSRIKDVILSSSSLWNAYWRHLQYMAQERGIAWSAMEEAAEQAWQAEAVVDVASTRILGSHLFKHSDRVIVPGKHYQ